MRRLKEVGQQDSRLAAELQIVSAQYFRCRRVEHPFRLCFDRLRITRQPDCLVILDVDLRENGGTVGCFQNAREAAETGDTLLSGKRVWWWRSTLKRVVQRVVGDAVKVYSKTPL
jgi:hypothetical protein